MNYISSAGKESACNARDPSLIPGSGRSPGEVIGYRLQYSQVSLVVQLVENLPTMQETWVPSRVGKIPWRRERLPTPVFWSGKFHGLYSPWGCKESGLSHFHFHIIISLSHSHYTHFEYLIFNMWLRATALNSTDIERFHSLENFFFILLL